jgi:Flp pilus assembly protein TadD
VSAAPPAAASGVPQTSATGSLVALADRQAAAGDYAAAAAQLERALRIRPQDPLLWQKLAWLRLRNGDFEQAATLAARSDALAGNNAELRAQNRRIIELARARQRP